MRVSCYSRPPIQLQWDILMSMKIVWRVGLSREFFIEGRELFTRARLLVRGVFGVERRDIL